MERMDHESLPPKLDQSKQPLLPRQVRQNQDYLGLGFIQNIVSTVSLTLVAVDCSGNQAGLWEKNTKQKQTSVSPVLTSDH